MASFELDVDFAQELALRRELQPYEAALGAVQTELSEVERQIQFVLGSAGNEGAESAELIALRAERLRQKEVRQGSLLEQEQRAFTKEAFRQYMRTVCGNRAYIEF